eukprot:Phypoly_transcript_11602.p1 GENE.Phypoly_transcript_11602~~Phypoly_transcript_11602.p1  ORF type:complete len:348 (+),score=29.66 Phypoly_transcript_11602:104-1147(+)
MHKLLDKVQEKALNHVSALHSKMRTAVSRDKYRFQDGTFDLDLCYITTRIIAMGFPGTAFEKAWRNSKDEVCQFLQVYHDNSYLVINVSERVYDPLPLQRVEYFGWPDHHAPSLTLLLACVQRIDQWLLADPQNVVAIHCMAGRGRTGTVIAAFLLYIKMFLTAADALSFFASRRSSTGEGVQVPSQIRFVEYFAEMVEAANNGMPTVPVPRRLKLKCIIMRPIPEDFDLTGDFTPSVVIEWFTPRQPITIFNNQSSNLRSYLPRDSAILVDTQSLPIEGDILIRVHSEAMLDTLSPRPVFQFAFNTAFVKEYVMDFPRNQLDSGGPGPIKDERIAIDFCVRIMFTD